MTVQCVSCSRFSFKEVSKEWLAQGFGLCDQREKFIVYGAKRERDCATFAAADANVVAKRIEWLKAREAEIA